MASEDSMEQTERAYPARLEIGLPGVVSRWTPVQRLIWSLPALLLLIAMGGWQWGIVIPGTEWPLLLTLGGGTPFVLAPMLMIVVRQRYPRWWFDFNLEFVRFGARVFAYWMLLTHDVPSADDEQSVHLEIDYPEVERDLNRWLPLVKWLLAIPHYMVLAVLLWLAVLSYVYAWWAMLIAGIYPESNFKFAVGVGRYVLRVFAYAFLMTTDEYPPFSLSP